MAHFPGKPLPVTVIEEPPGPEVGSTVIDAAHAAEASTTSVVTRSPATTITRLPHRATLLVCMVLVLPPQTVVTAKSSTTNEVCKEASSLLPIHNRMVRRAQGVRSRVFC